VNTDSEAVWYVNEFWKELLELGRPSALDVVRALGNEVVGVFKARNGGGFFAVKEPEGERAGYGFARGLLADESELYHSQQLSTINQQLLFILIDIVYTKQSAGKGGGFAESHKQSLVDLAEGFNIDSAEEQNEASKGEDGGGDELYDSFFHNFYILHFGDIFIAIPFTFHFSFVLS